MTMLNGEVVAVVRVYSGGKWVKVIHEDQSVSWVRESEITEE